MLMLLLLLLTVVVKHAEVKTVLFVFSFMIMTLRPGVMVLSWGECWLESKKEELWSSKVDHLLACNPIICLSVCNGNGLFWWVCFWLIVAAAAAAAIISIRLLLLIAIIPSYVYVDVVFALCFCLLIKNTKINKVHRGHICAHIYTREDYERRLKEERNKSKLVCIYFICVW